MFLKVPVSCHPDQWVCYTLKNEKGELLFLDIVRLKILTQFENAPIQNLNHVYLEILDHDTDRTKLANRMIPAHQWRIVEIVKGWNHGNKKYGTSVICNETGEAFPSIKAASIAHNLSYSQLLLHLKRNVGYKTVKGRTYRYE